MRKKVDIIIDDTHKLEEILKEPGNKGIITTLLECVLNIQIKDLQYVETEKYSGITEYDFSLAKIIVKLLDDEERSIYMKMIKGGKIKESIFCYWSLLYEEYLNNRKNINKVAIPKNVGITEKSIEDNKKNIILTLNKDIQYNTEIILVEKKFVIEKSKEENNLKKWLDYLEDDKDILFLGMI